MREFGVAVELALWLGRADDDHVRGGECGDFCGAFDYLA